MTRKFPRMPRGFYGPNADGLGDPDRMTVADRATKSPERHDWETSRRRSASPLIRAFQRAYDRDMARFRRGKGA